MDAALDATSVLNEAQGQRLSESHSVFFVFCCRCVQTKAQVVIQLLMQIGQSKSLAVKKLHVV